MFTGSQVLRSLQGQTKNTERFTTQQATALSAKLKSASRHLPAAVQAASSESGTFRELKSKWLVIKDDCKYDVVPQWPCSQGSAV